MKYLLLFLTVSAFAIGGCTMFVTWKNIPPPGGCDQCHTLQIGANWKLIYQAASVSDERGRLPFQTPEYHWAASIRKEKLLDAKKVEEKTCFDCHRSPDKEHRDRKGIFHH